MPTEGTNFWYDAESRERIKALLRMTEAGDSADEISIRQLQNLASVYLMNVDLRKRLRDYKDKRPSKRALARGLRIRAACDTFISSLEKEGVEIDGSVRRGIESMLARHVVRQKPDIPPKLPNLSEALIWITEEANSTLRANVVRDQYIESLLENIFGKDFDQVRLSRRIKAWLLDFIWECTEPVLHGQDRFGGEGPREAMAGQVDKILQRGMRFAMLPWIDRENLAN